MMWFAGEMVILCAYVDRCAREEIEGDSEGTGRSYTGSYYNRVHFTTVLPTSLLMLTGCRPGGPDNE